MYSRSIRAVQRVKPYLDIIKNNDNKGNYITLFETEEPKPFAHALRQAKNIIEKLDHEKYNNYYLDYQFLALYRFRENSSAKRVTAERMIPEAKEIKVGRIEAPTHSFEALQEFHAEKVDQTVTDIYELISYLSENNTVNIRFENYRDTEPSDKKKLERWCSVNNYEVTYKENGIVLRRKT